MGRSRMERRWLGKGGSEKATGKKPGRKIKTDDPRPDSGKSDDAALEAVANEPVEKNSDKPTEQYIPVGEEQPMTVGAHLCIARKNAGLSIEQVAEALRLRPSQITAIENSQYDLLPGQTFVTGFLRSYANYLDLDGVDVVQMFRDEDAGKIQTPDLVFPEPVQEGRMPGFGLLVAVTLGAAAIFVGWNYYELRSTVKLEYVETVPDHLAERIEKSDDLPALEVPPAPEVLPAPEIQLSEKTGSDGSSVMDMSQSIGKKETVSIVTEPELAKKDDASEVTAKIDAEPAGAITTSQSILIDDPEISKNTQAQKPDMAAVQLKAEPAPTSGIKRTQADKLETSNKVDSEHPTASSTVSSDDMPEKAETIRKIPIPKKFASTQFTIEDKQPLALGIENTDARIVVRAQQESWVQIYSDDGSPILTRVLRPGDSFMVPNQSDLKLMTGNAGGLEIRVDGKNIPPLGEKGAIVSDFDLVADMLLQTVESSN